MTILPGDLPRTLLRDDPSIAVIASDGQKTFRELRNEASSLKEDLTRRLSVAPRDRVVLQFARSDWVAFLVTYLALQMADAVPVIVSSDVGSRGARLAAEQLGCTTIIDSSLHPAAVTWGSAADDTAYRPMADTRPLFTVETADIICTSGSTGTPKAVAVTVSALLAELMQRAGGRPGERLMHAFPPAGEVAIHVVAMTSLLRGWAQIALPTSSPPILLSAIEQHRPDVLILSPHQVGPLVAHVGNRSLVHSISRVHVFGDHLSDGAAAALSALLPGAKIIEHYGTTEGGNAFLTRHHSGPRLFQGMAPSANTEVRITDDNCVVGDGSVGEVEIRNVHLSGDSRRYSIDTIAEQGAWRSAGWVRTGDRGHLDKRGRLHLVGRGSDSVTIHGGRYDLVKLRNLVARSGLADDFTTHVSPNEDGVDQVTVYVQYSGSEDVGGRFECIDGLLPISNPPVHWQRVPRIPRSATGKLLLNEMLEELRLPPLGRAGEDFIEEGLRAAWISILGPSEVTPQSDFFEDGADSLSAVELAERLSELFGTEVPPYILVEAGTFMEMVRRVTAVLAEGR